MLLSDLVVRAFALRGVALLSATAVASAACAGEQAGKGEQSDDQTINASVTSSSPPNVTTDAAAAQWPINDGASPAASETSEGATGAPNPGAEPPHTQNPLPTPASSFPGGVDEPASSVPSDSAVPRDTFSDRSVPKDTSSDRSVPRDAGRDSSVPKTTSNDSSVPRDAGRDSSVPIDAGSDSSVPSDAAMDSSAPVDTSSDRPVSSDAPNDRPTPTGCPAANDSLQPDRGDPIGTTTPTTDPTGNGSVFPPSVTRPRLMIVGDSISAGPGCYKKYLDQYLKDDLITNYEFVGEYADHCGSDIRHSAVSCTTSAQYTQPTFTDNCFPGETFPGMSTLVASHNPDLIMVQLGVNEIWGGGAPIEPILANYETLVQQARAHNPNIVVVVAQVHRIITDDCTSTASTANAEELAMAVPQWAAGVSTPESPVFAADLWTNSVPCESDDCVHPNDAGAQRMGRNWFNALRPLLK